MLLSYGADQFEQFEQDGVTVVGDRLRTWSVDWHPVEHGHTLGRSELPIARHEYREVRTTGGRMAWPIGPTYTYPQNFPKMSPYVGRASRRLIGTTPNGRGMQESPTGASTLSSPHAQTGTATSRSGIAASDPLHGRTTHTLVKVKRAASGRTQLVKFWSRFLQKQRRDSFYS